MSNDSLFDAGLPNPDVVPKPFAWGCLLKTLLGIGATLILLAMLLPNVRMAGEAARRTQCKSNLKQIGLALHNYASIWGALPPAYTVDANGKPLHSWRTLILPHLDQAPLYNKINLSKAWDDPVNREVFKTANSVYQCPSITPSERRSTELPETHTNYLAVVGQNCCFHPTEPRRKSEITDGTSNTVMVIEVDPEHAVPWMAPVDADEQLFFGITQRTKTTHQGGAHALLADGLVRFISNNLPLTTRRAIVSIAGNEPATAYEF